MVCLCYAPLCAPRQCMCVCVRAHHGATVFHPSLNANMRFLQSLHFPRKDCLYGWRCRFAYALLCWCLAPHLCFHSTHTQSHIYMAYECVRIIITFNFSKVFFSVEMLVVRCCCDDAAKCNCPAIFSVIAAVVHESRVHANCVNFDIVINFPALTTRDCAQDDVFPFPCERENEQESNFEWI